ncbi:MAG: hypothetical protein MZU79_09080 [Anaerotruncus sp.]|nr:hypothetical protein [Anaerotruncus sp.]
MRLWRPFPFEEFRKAVLGKKSLIVIDRAVEFRRTRRPGGIGTALGPVQEGKGAPTIVNYMAGLGRQGRVAQRLQDTSSSRARKRLPQATQTGSPCTG